MWLPRESLSGYIRPMDVDIVIAQELAGAVGFEPTISGLEPDAFGQAKLRSCGPGGPDRTVDLSRMKGSLLPTELRRGMKAGPRLTKAAKEVAAIARGERAPARQHDVSDKRLTRARLVIRGLLAIAEAEMPAATFEADPRVKRAKAFLKERP